MIEVINSKNIISIKGHADSASYGKDLVCAVVSALIEATIKSLNGFKKSDVKVKKGSVTININEKISKEDKIRLDLLIGGLKLIENKYPKFIRIKEK